MGRGLRELVARRSGGFCEYCRVPEAYDRLPFQLDHVVAEKHGGTTIEANLAWSCFDCNVFKGPNVGGIDPTTGVLTRLFHPRTDLWEASFVMNGATIVGSNAVGRATVEVLRLNLPRRVAVRTELISEGVYPIA
jgi:hypothetical protein